MANRAYMAFAAALLLAVLVYAFWDEGSLLPWDPRAVHSARVRPTWTIDLETGEQGTPRADLHWGMKSRDDPYLAAYGGALIARAGDNFDKLDARSLAALAYAPNSFPARGPEAVVKNGAVFGVRTREGAFAKVRVKDIRGDYSLVMEWRVYPAPAVAAAPAAKEEAKAKEGPARPESPKATAKVPAKAASNPSLAWQALRDEALAAYREQRPEDAYEACGKAIAAAARAGEAHQALALVTCGSFFDLHRRHPEAIEDWLTQGKAIALKLDQKAIVAALGPREAMLKERSLRMLGVFYRDRNRTAEAADNFALAVDTVRAMAPPETPDQRLALRSDLYDLGAALARLGYRGIAQRALEESRELYLKTEPAHPALKSIDAQLQRLQADGKKK